QLVVFSFKTLPIGSGSFNAVDFREMAGWLGIMFQTALSMSLSGIIALLTINLSFGVMTRAAPQLNIFSLGFAFALM
ncbi:flagellar biosynthetic protein FliR, partial [Vibrio parahaemolyticus]